ncbi:MAG: PIN domain nuclease [Thermoproteota archaeon]|nr:MAG: PIN domain nuclease [Candidatus Korarchaeota archaeon]
MEWSGGSDQMEESKVLVLDASVIVKWFNEEDYSDLAVKIRDFYIEELLEIEVPELMFYEVGNALRYNPNFGIEDVARALRDLEDLQLITHPLRGKLAELTSECAFRYGLTLYDSAYVALALLRRTTYYTADEDVVNRVSAPLVKHISEFKMSP